MVIGVCQLTYHFPDVNNLKQKRNRVNSIKEKLKKKYNISIAEVDYMNLWQKVLFGISMVSNNKILIEKIFSSLVSEIEKFQMGYISDIRTEYMNFGEIY